MTHFVIKSLKDFENHNIQKLIGTRRVILFIHAEWCGHCRVLLEKYERGKPAIWDVVKRNNPNVTVVEMESKVAEALVREKKESLLASIITKSLRGYPFIARVERVDAKNNTLSVVVFNYPERTVHALTQFFKSS